jgi:hypothetical protein
MDSKILPRIKNSKKTVENKPPVNFKNPQPIVENKILSNFDKSTIERNPQIMTFDDLFCSDIDANCNFPNFSSVPTPKIFVGSFGSSSEEYLDKIPEEMIDKTTKELTSIPEEQEVKTPIIKPVKIFSLPLCRYCDCPLKDMSGKLFDHTLASTVGCNRIEMKVTREEANSVHDKVSYNKVHYQWSVRNNLYF